MAVIGVDVLMQMSAAPDAAPRRETVDVSLVHRDSA